MDKKTYTEVMTANILDRRKPDVWAINKMLLEAAKSRTSSVEIENSKLRLDHEIATYYNLIGYKVYVYFKDQYEPLKPQQFYSHLKLRGGSSILFRKIIISLI